MVRLGERVRRARERVGLNQRQLAALTGISQPTISRVDSGERSALAVTELHRIAMATGTTVPALTSETDRGNRILTAARVAAAGDPAAVEAAASAAAELLELDALSLPGRQERREPAITLDVKGDPAAQGLALATEVRRRTGDEVVAAALSGHRLAGLTPDKRAEDMVRKVVEAMVGGCPAAIVVAFRGRGSAAVAATELHPSCT